MSGRSPKVASTSPHRWADRPLLVGTFLLMAVGLVMVFSASSIMSEARFGSAYRFFRLQLMWDMVGIVALLVCMRIDYHRWQKWSYGLLAISWVALALVLVVGPVVKGARRWIHLGPISFQPSELAKLSLLLTVANYLDRHQSHLKDFKKGFIPAALIIGATLGLIVLEPDLGTPMMLAAVCFIMLFMAGARLVHFVLCFLPVSPILYYLLFHVGYRRRRLLAFLNPWADSGGTGYQVTQSLMAFGSGGWFGKGLGGSTLKQLNLPDPHTDFIFPIVGEELGFVGAVALIILFIFWGLRGWQSARKAPDLYGQLLAAGITSWMLIQAFINMGVSCGILPTKGLPLPFISFGGSSMVISLAAVGILLNISGQGRWEKVQSFRKLDRRSRR